MKEEGFTVDGEPVVFEWNFGTASGTLEPGYYPFEANEIFSKLSGAKTWFWNFAIEKAGLSAAEQNIFLKTLKNEKPPWWRIQIEDISQLEWAAWLRNQRLIRWASQPNLREKVEDLRSDLDVLFDGLGTSGNLDFGKLRSSADGFINRKLKSNE